jgi:hypothetical protein
VVLQCGDAKLFVHAGLLCDSMVRQHNDSTHLPRIPLHAGCDTHRRHLRNVPAPVPEMLERNARHRFHIQCRGPSSMVPERPTADPWSSPKRTPNATSQRQSGRTVHRRERSATRNYQITSARTCSDWGIVRPSALAVFELMTSSNLVGCSTGRSAGFAPLRILSTYPAAMT